MDVDVDSDRQEEDLESVICDAISWMNFHEDTAHYLSTEVVQFLVELPGMYMFRKCYETYTHVLFAHLT